MCASVSPLHPDKHAEVLQIARPLKQIILDRNCDSAQSLHYANGDPREGKSEGGRAQMGSEEGKERSKGETSDENAKEGRGELEGKES